MTNQSFAQASASRYENGLRSPTWTTLDAVLAATGRSLVSIPTRRADAATIALDIGDAIAAGNERGALRSFIQLNDNLAAEHDEVRLALVLSEPAPTGRRRWDAALAGLVNFRLSEEDLPSPRWARDPSRRLHRPWTFGAGSFITPVDPGEVPSEFLAVNVLIHPDALVSV